MTPITAHDPFKIPNRLTGRGVTEIFPIVLGTIAPAKNMRFCMLSQYHCLGKSSTDLSGLGGIA